MTRKEQLLSIINKSGSESEAKTAQLVDEIIFIEEQLVKLKELPFIVVSSKNPGIQKATPASKQYIIIPKQVLSRPPASASAQTHDAET